jgi:EAL and modified HD-GYP domain-containing signal transduction protein
VKIDFRATSRGTRQEIDRFLAGSWALRIAEKVETQAEMQMARSEGCLLFQGYFFSRPMLMSSRALPQNRLIYLRLLAELNESPANLREVESLVLADTTLCYRVLRLANSAMQGHVGTVTTVREALLMVGEDALRHMVTVALAGVLTGHRPAPLVSMALARARFCELLAPALGRAPQQLYLLGMLSLLDVLLETPMERILKTLPLPCEMKAALAGEQCPLRPALDLIIGLEACAWDKCEAVQEMLGLTESKVAAQYVEALQWSSQALAR